MPGLPTALKHEWFHAKRRVREFAEDQWFDRTRHVHTSGDLSLLAAGVAAERHADSELYVPARPAHIREALLAAPVRDFSDYTYVDLGSGKGRSLFVAAEFPFRQIIGVEFSPVMHAQAVLNARSFHLRGKDGSSITAIHQDACEFAFPDGPLLLYMFNPFGPVTMQTVLEHLRASLQLHPRHVVVVLLWPRCAEQVARVCGMQQMAATERYAILQTQ